MATTHALLGLMEAQPSHGYTLKQAYDGFFGADRPLSFSQVYATLARLQRDGLADAVGVHPGSGPDRKLYAITRSGITELEKWLDEPVAGAPGLQNIVFTKVVLALMSGRPADQILDKQRVTNIARMRELAKGRDADDVVGLMTADFEIAHLEADLKWIELAGQRISSLSDRVRQ